MTEQSDRPSTVGRAKTVLVVNDGGRPVAVLSSVTAQARDSSAGPRVRLRGPCRFDERAFQHIEEVIMPLVQAHLSALSLPCPSYDLCVTNINAASAADVGFTISGFSADVPVFLALFSMGAGLAVPDDMVFTGHIASLAGDIRLVKEIAVKVEAAKNDPSIEEFVHPSLEADGSLQTLSPEEAEMAAAALSRAKERLRTTSVRNVAHLFPHVFPEDEIVRAALKKPFFRGATGSGVPSGYLAEDHEGRFQRAVGNALLKGDCARASEFLRDRIDLQIRREEYPQDLGKWLWRALTSLPPSIRRLKVTLPLVPIRACIAVSQFAGDNDLEDIPFLLDGTLGRNLKAERRPSDGEPASAPQDSTIAATLRTLLEETSEAVLAEKIGTPLDNARATYVFPAPQVDSPEEFYDALAAFHTHMSLYARQAIAPVRPEKAKADALALAERAFARDGGVKAAWAEARDAVHGGIRLIFDNITDFLKSEEQEKYLQRVLKETFGILDHRGQVALMKAFMEHLGPAIPDLSGRDPEEFVGKHEIIVRAYLGALRSLRRALQGR